MSLEVLDFRQVPNVLSPKELRFYFVANNTFHSYIHRSLSELHSVDRGQVIAVVHEPSCFMLHRHESYSGTNSMSVDQLERNLQGQYGGKARKFLDDLNAGHLAHIFEYVTLCSEDLTSKATELWTHSAYAACKLFLESRADVKSFPKIKVLQHPVYRYDSASITRVAVAGLAEVKPDFRIGIFGWVSETKRVREVLMGLGLFLDRLHRDVHGAIDLIVVGKLPPRETYDIFSEVTRLDLQPYVKIYEYVDAQKFRRLVQSCDLVFNLRYPSCGESSGAIAHAHGANVLTVSTRYQAFAEERSDYSIPNIPGLESAAAASIMARAFARVHLANADAQGSSPCEPVEPLDRPNREPAGADLAVASRCAVHLAEFGE